MIDMTMKGIYPIILTPFDDKDRVDVEDLQREVEFFVAAGAHGIGVANNSEAQFLSDEELDLVLETLVKQGRNRLKIVMTCTSDTTEHSLVRARKAEDLGAHALIAKPLENQEEPFRSLATATKLPVFIQDTNSTPIEVELSVKLARETENIRYGKLERQPDLMYIEQAVKLGGDRLVVFGGAGGSYFVEHMKRGSEGIMAAAPISDVMRRVWDLFQSGQVDAAEDEFNKYHPALKATKPPGISRYVTKEAMRLRGVFATTNTRQPSAKPDQWYYDEVKRVFEKFDLKPLVS